LTVAPCTPRGGDGGAALCFRLAGAPIAAAATHAILWMLAAGLCFALMAYA